MCFEKLSLILLPWILASFYLLLFSPSTSCSFSCFPSSSSSTTLYPIFFYFPFTSTILWRFGVPERAQQEDLPSLSFSSLLWVELCLP